MKSVCTAFLVALSFLGHMRAAEAQDLSVKAKKAESLNTEGKKLVSRLDLDGAAERFRDAWQLVRDPRFAFNLCYTLEWPEECWINTHRNNVDAIGVDPMVGVDVVLGIL